MTRARMVQLTGVALKEDASFPEGACAPQKHLDSGPSELRCFDQ